MPYTVSPGAILEVSVEGRLAGQEFISLFPYKFVGGTAIADGRAAALAVLAVCNAPGKLKERYRACLSEQATDVRLYAQWISPVRYAYVVDPTGAFNGIVVEDSYPPNVAVTVTKIGEQANRRNIGSLHMPGVPLSWVAAGEVQTPDAYDALGSEMLTQIVLGGGQEFDLVIFNRANPPQSPIMEDWVVQPTSRVMRRRTVGVGS